MQVVKDEYTHHVYQCLRVRHKHKDGHTLDFFVVPWLNACCGLTGLSYLENIKSIIKEIGYDTFIQELNTLMNGLNPGYNAQTFQLVTSEEQADWVPQVFKGAKPIHSWQNRNEGESFCTIFMWFPFGEEPME